jgi:hypothetical protein
MGTLIDLPLGKCPIIRKCIFKVKLKIDGGKSLI